MLTTPITTPHFHSRVLSLLSAHLSTAHLSTSDDDDDRKPLTSGHTRPAPIIPPFNAVDTPLTPGDLVSQLVGYSAPWIDLCSPDPLIANISRQVLTMEVAYAAFCGIGNIIIPGPRQFNSGRDATDGLMQYARAIQEALGVGSYVQMAIHLPMYDGESHLKETVGDLAPFAREEYYKESSGLEKDKDLFGTWDAWNVIRAVCKYNSRLTVGKFEMQPCSSASSPCCSSWNFCELRPFGVLFYLWR
jgi:protein arginine N-methyltransferase 5